MRRLIPIFICSLMVGIIFFLFPIQSKAQEQPVPTPEMQAIQEKWNRVQDELNHLNAIVALHQGRIKVLNSELKGFQDRFDVLFRQQQMDKKRVETEKGKVPEKKP